MVPGIDSPEIQRRLATNLEQSFGITLSPDDLSHMTTVRAVLQCVRLRRWEREVSSQPMANATPYVAANVVTAPPTRERFVRYTPPPLPPVAMPNATPSFALRKS